MSIAGANIAAPDLLSVVSAEARSAGRRAPRMAKTARTLIWVLALLVAGEAAVRMRAWYRHGSPVESPGLYERHDLLGRRPRPGATVSGADRHLSINQWGFRGADISLAKPKGTIRIAAVGDSTTFGMEASSNSATWVARAGAELGVALPRRSFDTINGGVPGYRLATSQVQLEHLIAPFDPDYVVVLHLANHVIAHSRLQFAPPASSSARTTKTLGELAQKYCLLLRLVKLNTMAIHAEAETLTRHDTLDDSGIRMFREELDDLIQVSLGHGWRVVLCTAPRAFGDASAPTDQYTLAASALAHNPSLSLRGLRDAYERYNQITRDTARAYGLPLVDLDALVPKRADYFTDAAHLNDRGHELVGKLVAEVIAADLERQDP